MLLLYRLNLRVNFNLPPALLFHREQNNQFRSQRMVLTFKLIDRQMHRCTNTGCRRSTAHIKTRGCSVSNKEPVTAGHRLTPSRSSSRYGKERSLSQSDGKCEFIAALS